MVTVPETSSGCAIAGALFYAPTTNQFPAEYQGDYFFADLCNAWIRHFDPASGTIGDFATDLPPATVDLRVDDAGALYYLSRGGGSNSGGVFRIEFPSAQPDHPWQNPVDPTDVDGQYGAAPIDVLMIINDLNAHGPRALTIPPPAAGGPPPYLDVNGDDFVTPIDVLVVINTLNNS